MAEASGLRRRAFHLMASLSATHALRVWENLLAWLRRAQDPRGRSSTNLGDFAVYQPPERGQVASIVAVPSTTS